MGLKAQYEYSREIGTRNQFTQHGANVRDSKNLVNSFFNPFELILRKILCVFLLDMDYQNIALQVNVDLSRVAILRYMEL
jgi:hypothetical protein